MPRHAFPTWLLVPVHFVNYSGRSDDRAESVTKHAQSCRATGYKGLVCIRQWIRVGQPGLDRISRLPPPLQHPALTALQTDTTVLGGWARLSAVSLTAVACSSGPAAQTRPTPTSLSSHHPSSTATLHSNMAYFIFILTELLSSDKQHLVCRLAVALL